MNEEQKTLRLVKMDIEEVHGKIGGFVFGHFLHTVKLMKSIEGITDEYDSDKVSSLSGLDSGMSERLRSAFAISQSRSEDSARQTIVKLHKQFVRLMGKSGIEVTYGYSGDEKKPKSERTVMWGDMTGGKGVVKIDLSKWLTVGVELY